MHLKIRKIYATLSDQGSNGIVRFNVEKVRTALGKFDNIDSSLNNIVNASNSSSTLKPSDLKGPEPVLTNLNTGDVIPLSGYSIPSSEMAAQYLIVVIERIRKLCDDIIKADNFELTNECEDLTLGSINTDANNSINPDKGQYTIEKSIVGIDSNGNKITISPGNYDIVEVRKDVSGNITDICILVGGQSVWISLTNKEIDVNRSDDPDKGQYTIEKSIVGIDSNGNKITISPGNYDIVEVRKDVSGNITDICILVGGQSVWISLTNKEIDVNRSDDPDKGQYTIENSIVGIDSNGNKITISPGNYNVVEVRKDLSGNITDICILVGGQSVWISLTNKEIDVNRSDDPDKGQYTIENSIVGIDSNGNKITISPGNYNVVEVRKDLSGNITDICILVGGQSVWISLTNKEIDVNRSDDPDKGQYTIENSIVGIDSNGNKITISPGNYNVVEVRKDVSGNITDICILVNGEKIWLAIINDNIFVNNELNIVGNQYKLITAMTVTDVDGNKIIINPGNYNVIDVKINDNGEIVAICILVNNDKVWLIIKNNQITETLLQTCHNGVYVFNDVSLNIYDKSGNKIGEITSGRYFVYEVIVDSNKNITWIRITKDGEPAYWINIYFQETNWGSFLTFEKEFKSENGILKVFKQNHSSIIGILGILIVSLGAIMYAKNSKKSKSINSGTFAVYEINKDENGNVGEVRVSSDDYDEEYWVKF